MRVLIYTHYFYPEHLAALSKRIGDAAKALARAGHEVTVVTGFPSHPRGKVYPGYGGSWVREEKWEEGVRVLRCRSYIRPFKKGLTRILNQTSLMVSALTLGSWKLKDYRADVVVSISPPLFTALAGVLAAKVRRVPFVLDVQDLWPEEAVAVGGLQSPAAVRLASGLAKFLYRNSSRILVISEGFARVVRSQGGAPDAVHVVPNWVREECFEEREAARLPGAGFRVVFAGTVGLAQGLETVVEAAERLRERDVSFVFVGEGVEKERLREAAQKKGLANLHFLPAVAQEELPGVLAAADALLVHLKPESIFEVVIPSKTYEYLAAGRPVLMGVPGDAARLVEDSGGGISFPSGDAAALAGAVEKMLDLGPEGRRELGEAGHEYARENFTAAKLTAFYEQLLREVGKPDGSFERPVVSAEGLR